MRNSLNDKPAFFHELGSTFTWSNPEQPNQKGWALDSHLRSYVANGTIKRLVIVLEASTVKTDGGLGGIEVILNSKDNGFRIDWKSFPWNWNKETQTGGYTSYNSLISGGYLTVNPETAFLKYDIISHPYYSGFKKEMTSTEWGEISIQYGIGIRHLPFVNAYLQSLP